MMESERDWITIDEMARLEEVSRYTLKKRFQRHPVAFRREDGHSQRRLYPISLLSPEAHNQWLGEQASPTQAGSAESLGPLPADFPPATQSPELPNQEASEAGGSAGTTALACTKSQIQPASAEISTVTARSAQPFLPFAPTSPSQQARDAVVAAVPKEQRTYVDRWLSVIADNVNGTWKIHQGRELAGYLIRNREDFMRAQAHLYGVSRAAIYAKIGQAREILSNPGVPKTRKWATIAEQLAPKPRPGRSGHSFFAELENAWMWPELRRIYLNQARHSVRAAHAILLDIIDKKQHVHGMGHLYQPPTEDQCRTALKQIPKIERVLGREGEKSFNDKCAKYLSRDPASLHASDLWVTDQKQVDVRLRDGGEHLGRIWMVNFLDVATDKVLGYAFGPILSSDMVMMAATMAIERYGVPRAVHMDLGKEFICKAFNGSVRKFSGEVLYREAQGLWNALIVQIVKAIGRNPQSKTIERWHGNLPAFDRCFPGYCGSNTDQRPEKLVAEESQHLAWLAGGADHTPLVTIGQYIHAYINWAENDWNGGARGRGKMRRGMTPNEAWNVKRPAEGLRTVSADMLDHASADHRRLKVARGGQINLTFFGQTIEYESGELFQQQGEEVEVIISRRTFRQITVLYPVPGGRASCVAHLKPQLAWLPENREELRAAMRCKAAVHRAIRQGLKASKVALEAANPVELLEQQKALPAKDIIGSQKFFSGAPAQPDPDAKSISSSEYVMRQHTKTSSELAEKFLKMEEQQ